jgi:hypothetical protein
VSGILARLQLRVKLASERREGLRLRARRVELQKQTQAHYREVTAAKSEPPVQEDSEHA